MSALGGLQPVQLFYMKAATVPAPPHTHSLQSSYRGHTECGPEPQITRLIGSTFRLKGRIMAIIDFSVCYIDWEPNLALPLTNYITWGKLFHLPRSQDSIIIVTIIWKIICFTFWKHRGKEAPHSHWSTCHATEETEKLPELRAQRGEEKTQSEPAPQASKHHLCMAPARPVARALPPMACEHHWLTLSC